MLPFLIALLVAAGPLLRGAWDLWAQTALLIVVAGGTTAWLVGRIATGYLPVPSGGSLAWAAGLFLLGSLSAHMSQLPSFAFPAWRPWLAALWLILTISAVSKDERAIIDEAIRAAAWVLLLLVVYQRFAQGIERPFGSLLNPNILAGTLLMLLTVAVQKSDWPLAAGLLAALFWTRSVGAWLGLAAALVFCRRRLGPLSYWAGLAIGLGCAAAVYGKLQAPEALHRWQWWRAAAHMSWDRPWLGFGPGAFAYVLPAYQRAGEFSSLYAHQHFLETAAEFGVPYLLLWAAGLILCARGGGPAKSFGVLAVMTQSLWDYVLSVPANLWLFAYFAASAIPETSRGMNVPSRYKLPACLLALGLGVNMSRVLWKEWKADQLRAEAMEILSSRSDCIPSRSEERAEAPRVGRCASAPSRARSALESSAALADHPETQRLLTEVELRENGRDFSPAGRLLAAAARLERSALLNPYRATTWVGLERLYLQLGRSELALRKRAEGSLFCPVLRDFRRERRR